MTDRAEVDAALGELETWAHATYPDNVAKRITVVCRALREERERASDGKGFKDDALEAIRLGKQAETRAERAERELSIARADQQAANAAAAMAVADKQKAERERDEALAMYRAARDMAASSISEDEITGRTERAEAAAAGMREALERVLKYRTDVVIGHQTSRLNAAQDVAEKAREMALTEDGKAWAAVDRALNSDAGKAAQEVLRCAREYLLAFDSSAVQVGSWSTRIGEAGEALRAAVARMEGEKDR